VYKRQNLYNVCKAGPQYMFSQVAKLVKEYTQSVLSGTTKDLLLLSWERHLFPGWRRSFSPIHQSRQGSGWSRCLIQMPRPSMQSHRKMTWFQFSRGISSHTWLKCWLILCSKALIKQLKKDRRSKFWIASLVAWLNFNYSCHRTKLRLQPRLHESRPRFYRSCPSSKNRSLGSKKDT